MSIMRSGQKVFTVPGSDWGVRMTQSAAAAAYSDKVLSYGPLVYFPQWEPAGLVSEELVNTWNGAYSPGITLGQPGIGDGNTCPWFDGANDFNDIWTAALQAAFDGGEGTAMIWVRVNDIGVWADGQIRSIMSLRVDGNNFILICKWFAINRLTYWYMAGGVDKRVNLNGIADVDYFQAALTWSISAPPTGEIRAYYNGAQTGATSVGLGIWAGNIAAASTCIGATTTVPTNSWHGRLAHGAVWDRPLDPAEIADLAIV